MTTIYGIPSCDTTKQTMKWFKTKNIAFLFHDYRAAGISAAKLNEWCAKEGWEKILNKKSTSWRSLTPSQQSSVSDQQSAVKLMLENTTLIKRPIVEHKNALMVGFDEQAFTQKIS